MCNPCVEESGSFGDQLAKQNDLNDGTEHKTSGINIFP